MKCGTRYSIRVPTEAQSQSAHLWCVGYQVRFRFVPCEHFRPSEDNTRTHLYLNLVKKSDMPGPFKGCSAAHAIPKFRYTKKEHFTKFFLKQINFHFVYSCQYNLFYFHFIIFFTDIYLFIPCTQTCTCETITCSKFCTRQTKTIQQHRNSSCTGDHQKDGFSVVDVKCVKQ